MGGRKSLRPQPSLSHLLYSHPWEVVVGARQTQVWSGTEEPDPVWCDYRHPQILLLCHPLQRPHSSLCPNSSLLPAITPPNWRTLQPHHTPVAVIC